MSRWYDEHGQITGVTCATIDITSRRLAEEARLQSEERFRQLFEFSPVALCEFDCSEALDQIQDWRLSGVQDLRQYLIENEQAALQCARLTHVLDVNQAALELYAAHDKAEFAVQQIAARLLSLTVLCELLVRLVDNGPAVRMRNYRAHLSGCR